MTNELKKENPDEQRKTFEFTREIQEKIIAMLLSDKEKLAEALPLIEPEHFLNPAHQDFFKIVSQFYSKYNRPPTEDEFLEELRVLLELEKNSRLPKDEYWDVAAAVIESSREGDFSYVRDKLFEFAQHQAMTNAILDSVDVIQKKKEYKKILENVENALAIGAKAEGLDTVVLSEVEEKPVEWFWQQRIPKGKPSLVVGDPGVGKSYLSTMMIAHVTIGQPWPTEPSYHVEKGTVLVLTAEDGLDDIVAPRVRLNDGDKSKVVVIRGTLEREGRTRMFNLITDLGRLEREIKNRGDIKLIVIDPISSYLGIGKEFDSHRDKDVRGMLLRSRCWLKSTMSQSSVSCTSIRAKTLVRSIAFQVL